MLPLRIWTWLDEFWPHFGTMATCTNPVVQETNLTDLCHVFLRAHQPDFYNFWIRPQDVSTMLPLRIWTWLDEFSLLCVVFELSCSLVWSQNDTFELLRTYFAFRLVWVSLSLQQIYYALSDDKIASKNTERYHLIDFDCLERPKHAFEPKSATSAAMPKQETFR